MPEKLSCILPWDLATRSMGKIEKLVLVHIRMGCWCETKTSMTTKADQPSSVMLCLPARCIVCYKDYSDLILTGEKSLPEISLPLPEVRKEWNTLWQNSCTKKKDNSSLQMAYGSSFWPLIVAGHCWYYSSHWKVKPYCLLLLREKK